MNNYGMKEANNNRNNDRVPLITLREFAESKKITVESLVGMTNKFPLPHPKLVRARRGYYLRSELVLWLNKIHESND